MSGIRVRRHTDGRVAIGVIDQSRAQLAWHLIYQDGCVSESWPESEFFGKGWVELLVAELPEPDGQDPEGAQHG